MPPGRLEALHAPVPGVAVVVVGLLDVGELAVGVATDHRPPELLRADVARELRELPWSRRQVEGHPRRLLADALPPELAEHEELADLVRAGAGIGGLVADQHEPGQRAVGADEERAAPALRPEALDLLGAAEEAVGADVPAVDRAEIVEVELHHAPEDGHGLGAGFVQGDLDARTG